MFESLSKVIINDILREPAFLVGFIAMAGYIALKKKPHEIFMGFLKPMIGFLMLNAGAGIIVNNLAPLGQMVEVGFNIKGVAPNNEAIVSIAQKVLGIETLYILFFGYIVNILVARFTRYKYVFLTGHHSFFMTALLSAVLAAGGLAGIPLIAVGAGILGLWSAISPAIGQKYTSKVTENDGIALGHFGSLGYYLSAWIGSKVGSAEDSTEKNELPESWSFLRDTTISTALIMLVFYLIAAIAAGQTYVEANLSNGQNFIVFSIMTAFLFAVGVTVVYSGVRMILAELLPAFKGVSQKIIPNAIPAVDCAVFFPYAPTAVVIGFISSLLGGILGMFLVGMSLGIFIIPGMVPHFFCGATAGIYGNATGGRKGAVIGAFIQGIAITILPALLIGVLGNLGFENTTFGDFDFAVLGLVIGKAVGFLGIYGAIIVLTLMVLTVVISIFSKNRNTPINFNED
ncbi:MAG: PTS ascorbate transporter subunit IIC [Treponemataceae bacterium]